MIICGVKASHDGGVALVENGRLLASIEVEKIANGRRYSPLGTLARVGEILRGEGMEPADVDRFVIDGWGAGPGVTSPSVDLLDEKGAVSLPVAPYVDGESVRDPLRRYDFAPVRFGADADPMTYVSYHHASNHIMGSYCTSPFARRREDALVVVWDGGMGPRAYQVSAARRTVEPVAQLFPVVGNIFPAFCAQFEPFRRDTSQMTSREEFISHHLEIAGKAMAYAALGTESEDAFEAFDSLFAQFPLISMDNVFQLGEKAVANRRELFPGLGNADIVATFQAYLGRKLQDALTRLVRSRHPDAPPNLCLGGGCALNIKWNSGLRASGLFRDIWVPPFPNDSGAAIGTACCEMFGRSDAVALDWDVYQGPMLATSTVPAGWTARSCTESELGALLHQEGEPVVVLSGRAELGPRALGNRSIIAPAVDPRMKELLNDLKGRAAYRPVAPVCLESRAPEVFEPGSPDPFMLFEHRMRPGWAERVPAVVHLDGSARLQTVGSGTRSPIVGILTEYARLSGIPVLCNTSANLNGRGFFPDVRTAAQWGRTRHIWSDGTLYTHPDPDKRAG
ncbi:MAG TPA: carbamoyltransferase N-terminal domain-containing protein [Streptomyces sp.]